MAERLNLLVDGGKATAGTPIGPALGPLGMNIGEVVAAINAKTKAFTGMKVPVTLIIDPKTKAFEIEVGTPPASALILKEAGIEKGSGEAGKNVVGNLSLKSAIKIAEMKRESSFAKDRKAGVSEIAGTCVTMGITVDGMPPKDFQKELAAGRYDKQLAG